MCEDGGGHMNDAASATCSRCGGFYNGEIFFFWTFIYLKTLEGYAYMESFETFAVGHN